ncbi:hypothetical protein ACFOEQ_01750 [Chryseobacterium arachidis]|uniref:hypothetical protein n=1 Tax=Chryseobacterium arachidis TaxID=1416778 RepID=UPI0036081C1B
MKFKIFSGFLPIAALLLASSLEAQNFQQMPIASGLTSDVIANGIGSSAISTSTDVDGVSYAFVSRDFQVNASSTPLTYGLPVNRLINSVVASTPGLSYQLPDYNSSNSLKLSTQNSSGTITFTTPIPAFKLYMLATSGSGASTVSAVVNFTDGTSQTFTGVAVPDWYDNTGFAVQGFGRINRTNDNLEASTTNPRLYQILLTIGAGNQSKPIQSVTVTKTSSAQGHANIFAFSADAYSDCAAPTLNAVGTLTSSSADVSWTAPTGTIASSYDIFLQHNQYSSYKRYLTYYHGDYRNFNYNSEFKPEYDLLLLGKRKLQYGRNEPKRMVFLRNIQNIVWRSNQHV